MDHQILIVLAFQHMMTFWPLTDSLALDLSTHQSQSSPIPIRCHTHSTRYDGGAQGIRTLLLQIISLACSLYTIRSVRRTRGLGLLGGLEERELMLPRSLTRRSDPRPWRRIVTCMTTCEGSEPRRCYHMLRNEWTCVGLTASLSR